MKYNEYDDDVDTKLIHTLSIEIYKDGGASLVRDLKDYNNEIVRLLRKCHVVKNKKLLSFIECYPSVFEVDRHSLPHVVYLLADNCYDDKVEEHSAKLKKNVEQALHLRIGCILKKERLKKSRRRNRKDLHQGTDTETYNDGRVEEPPKPPESFFGVNPTWLQKQCATQFHQYLRLCGYYQSIYSSYKDVTIVGTKEWNEVVAHQFQIIIDKCDYCSYQNGKITLLTDDKNHNNEENIQRIAIKLKEKVEEDGGVHISFSLLLLRNPDLCALLSGYDLLSLQTNYSKYFEDVNIFVKHNDVYIQSKTTRKEGRMEVDETGLFSVASAKWGNTFASTMAKHCRQSLSSHPGEIIAIDLTASVGGLTLPFAKVFKSVVAIEIDEHRSMLCRRNMQNFGVIDRVQILNQDSIECIPKVANEIIENRRRIVIVDPPWGGMYYKHEQNEILMGQWTMPQVMERIAAHLSPTIVGFRMPLSYNSDTFLNSLEELGIEYSLLEMRKAGPQLFLILSAL